MAQLTADQCKQKGDEKIKLYEYDAAMKYYQFGIHQNPEKMEIYNNMGNIYLHFSSYNEAVKYYDKALKLNNSNYAAFHNRANCYYHMKQYDKAMQDFSKALELDTTSVSCYGLALTYYAKENMEQALSYIEKAISLNQNDYEYYLLKARILDKSTEDRIAIMREYDRALSLKPDLPRIYMERGNMLEAWGEKKAAKENFKTAKGLEKLRPEGELYTNESMIVYL